MSLSTFFTINHQTFFRVPTKLKNLYSFHVTLAMPAKINIFRTKCDSDIAVQWMSRPWLRGHCKYVGTHVIIYLFMALIDDTVWSRWTLVNIYGKSVDQYPVYSDIYLLATYCYSLTKVQNQGNIFGVTPNGSVADWY